MEGLRQDHKIREERLLTAEKKLEAAINIIQDFVGAVDAYPEIADYQQEDETFASVVHDARAILSKKASE